MGEILTMQSLLDTLRKDFNNVGVSEVTVNDCTLLHLEVGNYYLHVLYVAYIFITSQN